MTHLRFALIIDVPCSSHICEITISPLREKNIFINEKSGYETIGDEITRFLSPKVTIGEKNKIFITKMDFQRQPIGLSPIICFRHSIVTFADENFIFR